MAWIPSHTDTSRHPKTKQFARELNIERATALGHLHAFWHYVMDFHSNGDITKANVTDVTEAALWCNKPEDFMAALLICGFTEKAGEYLLVHDWHEYGGKLLETKTANAERQAKFRSRHKKIKSQEIVTVTSQNSNNVTKQDSNAAEKRREEKSTEEEKREECTQNGASTPEKDFSDPIKKFPEITKAIFNALGKKFYERYQMGTVSATRKMELQKLVGMLAHEERTVEEIKLFKTNWPLYLNNEAATEPLPAQMLDKFDQVVSWKPRETGQENAADLAAIRAKYA